MTCRSRGTRGPAASCALRTYCRDASSFDFDPNRYPSLFAERLLFDTVSLHNPALGGDRQIPPISVQEETVYFTVTFEKASLTATPLAYTIR